MRRARVWLVGVSIAALTWSAAPATEVARAEEPLDIEGQLTDQVEALDDDAAEVQAAVDRLLSEHGQRLYVIYVDDFSGWDAQDWADATASRNMLTVDDALLAIATTERGYALSVDPAFPLSRRQRADVQEVAIEPALRASDWSAAAVAAADAFAAVRDGEEVLPPRIDPEPSAPAGESTGTEPWVVMAAGAAVVLIAALVAWWLVRRRARPAPSDATQGHP